MARRRLHARSPGGYRAWVSPRSTLAVAASLALIPACGAHAATKSVMSGLPAANQKAFDNLGADVNAYFPSKITIHRGDKVRFVPPNGLHSVDLPSRGGAAALLVSPGAPISGVRDAAGVPYWFNGQPDLELTSSLLNGSFGKSLSYSGQQGIQSGLPFTRKPLTVKLTKTGTFTYFCNVHSGMKGKVTVVRPGSKIPSAKADAKAVKKQVAAALKEAKQLQTTFLPKDTIQLGNGGRTGVEILAMYPGTITVPVGTVLTFQMSRFSVAAHTATTGPGDPLREPDSFLGRMSASVRATPPFDQAGVYPSDERGVPALLNPSLHGNGFWSSGFMDRSDATPQPKTAQVKIVAPGTYNFYCLLHPFMKIAVTAT
jgi:plastocyanin